MVWELLVWTSVLSSFYIQCIFIFIFYLFSHTYNVGLRKKDILLPLFSVARELKRKPEACVA